MTTAPKPIYSGKVRDTYVEDEETLVIVASDRISTHDVVHDGLVPNRGHVLTALTEFWLEQLLSNGDHHLITTDISRITNPELVSMAKSFQGRGMLVRRVKILPIECIVRGHLFGSVVKEYEAHGTVCGIEVPSGLAPADKFDEPLFTPSTKAEIGEHDENVTEEVARRILEEAGFDPAFYDEIKKRSIDLFVRAREHAAARGIIIADTKFEFGIGVDGVLVLADEVLTPDSSRFWDKETWERDRTVVQFDKQRVRDFVTQDPDWDKKTPVTLPEDVLTDTSQVYEHMLGLLTGPPLSMA